MAGTHSEFPKNEWDLLLPQAELTVNLLRSSRINPRLSAEEQMNGTFDYNNTPLDPLGINIIAHEISSHRASWVDHGKEGWYIRSSLDKYKNYTVFLLETRGTQDSIRVVFFQPSADYRIQFRQSTISSS